MRMWRYLALAAVVLLGLTAIGCGGRDMNSAAEALVGHWAVEGGQAKFYFASDGSFTRVDIDRKYPGTWTVVGDPEALSMVVNLDYEPEIEPVGDADLRLTFEPGYKSLTAGAPDVITSGTSLVWKYADDATMAP
jgi:hypothetical protein